MEESSIDEKKLKGTSSGSPKASLQKVLNEVLVFDKRRKLNRVRKVNVKNKNKPVRFLMKSKKKKSKELEKNGGSGVNRVVLKAKGRTPQLLNSLFRVVSYNGGYEAEGLKVENILKTYDEEKQWKHCSESGKNYDLLLKYCGEKIGGGESFLLTNFTILGPYKCTAPIKSGIVFVWKEKPKISEYTKEFDFASESKFKKIMSVRNSTKFEAFYFQTTSEQKLYHFQTSFEKGIVGKYMHIKFISSWADLNIDVERIGILGYLNGEAIAKGNLSFRPYKMIPRELKLTRVFDDFYRNEWNFVLEFQKDNPRLDKFPEFLKWWDINSFFMKKRLGLLHLAFYYEDPKNRYELIKFLLEFDKHKKKIDPNQVDTVTKKSPFHYAASCKTCTVKMMQLLEDNGCKVDSLTKLNETALHYAIFYCPQNIDNILYLLRKGVSINAKANNDLTPFHYTILTKKTSFELVKIAIAVGADFSSKSSDGNSIFHMLFMTRGISLSVVKLIIEKGLEKKLNINEKNNLGNSPAHYLAKFCVNKEIMKYMFSKKLNFDVKDKDGETPLHYSASVGNLPCCEFLVKNGVDIHAENDYGENCLHMAASNEKDQILNFLILVGANYRKSDKYGNTPFSRFSSEKLSGKHIQNYRYPKWYDLSTELREEDVRLRVLLETRGKKNLGNYFRNFSWDSEEKKERNIYYSDVLNLIEDKNSKIFEKVMDNETDRKLFEKTLLDLKPYLTQYSSSRVINREDEELIKVLYETRNEGFFKNFFFKNIHFSDLEQLLRPNSKIDLNYLIPDQMRRAAFISRVKEIFFSEAYTSGYLINPTKISTKGGRIIGKGQYGVVRSGKFYLSNTVSKSKSGNFVHVAVKQVPISDCLSGKKGTAKEDFLHEVELMLQVDDHPNVLKCYGCYFVGDQGYIVSELCKKDLYHFLMDSDKKISPQLAVDLYIQIAKGMLYLHTKGIIHRDLKSPNILIGMDNKLKIADFGTSRRSETINQTFAGTVEYMAPELSTHLEQYHKKRFDKKLLDVYSFGIMGYVVWTRRRPYKDLDGGPFQKLRLIHKDGLRPNTSDMRHCPDKIIRLVKACWNENPKKRPKSFAQIVTTLVQIRNSLGRGSGSKSTEEEPGDAIAEKSNTPISTGRKSAKGRFEFV